MKRTDITIMPEYYDRYINLVEDIDILDALKKYGANIFDKDKLKQLGEKVYEPGKWTAKEMIQHIIDGERIFSYRALRFARKDKTPLPGFNENDFTPASEANRRGIDDLLSEYDTVRQSTIQLFRSFTDEMQQRTGIASNKEVSVLAVGFISAGHGLHHVNVLKERYYKLI